MGRTGPKAHEQMSAGAAAARRQTKAGEPHEPPPAGGAGYPDDLVAGGRRHCHPAAVAENATIDLNGQAEVIAEHGHAGFATHRDHQHAPIDPHPIPMAQARWKGDADAPP